MTTCSTTQSRPTPLQPIHEQMATSSLLIHGSDCLLPLACDPVLLHMPANARPAQAQDHLCRCVC